MVVLLLPDFAIGNLTQTFNDPTVTRADNFGFPVAINGTNVLIGASNDITNGRLAGQAHLFDVVTGNLVQTFNNPNATGLDLFGRSVAIDGNYSLIGAPRNNTNGNNVGQAHLFDATTGKLVRTFDDPTATGGDYFGFSVAIDGSYVLIGAPWDNTNGTNVGQAHLFDAETGNLLQTFNDPTATFGDRFGFSVAIDDSNVLIGAYQDDTNGTDVGQAHLFDSATGNLLQTFNDPTVTGRDNFGGSVAIDGRNVLIGASHDNTNGRLVGQAHLFDTATGNLLQTFNDPMVTNSDAFGVSVALDGSNVLVGAHWDDTNGIDVGQAHLFDAATGNLLQTFNDPTVTRADQFGISVALDGSNVLIGSLGDDTKGTDVGQAHLFDISVPEPGSGLLLVSVSLLGYSRLQFCKGSFVHRPRG